ncbi:MAG: hypothetical protein HQL52_08465 [Magnetococcales bacterium]|nr:hypothetical protein [Magnetococcales bacterium]
MAGQTKAKSAAPKPGNFLEKMRALFAPQKGSGEKGQSKGDQNLGEIWQQFKQRLSGKSASGESHEIVGIISRFDGVGLVHVMMRASGPPVLKLCLFKTLTMGRTADWAIASMVRENQLEKAHFVTLLEPEEYSILPAEAPDVAKEELNSAVRWKIKDQLDFSATEAVVETFDLPSNQPDATSGRLYAVATRQSDVLTRIAPFHQHKFELKTIDIHELALLNLTMRCEDSADGMGILFLRAKDGLVMAVRDGTMYMARQLEVGLERLLESLDGRAQVDPKELADSPVLDNIALEVQRTLDYYESHFMQPPASSLHLAPLEISFPGLTDALADKLGMRVKRFPVTEIFEYAQEFETTDVGRCLPALGAVLRPEAE